MTADNITDCERREVNRILNMGLPSYFRPIGIGIASLTMLYLISSKIFDYNITGIKEALKSVILLGGFIAVLAKDKVQDEREIQIRGQAFTISFIFASVYGLAIPWFEYVVDLIQGNEAVLKEGDSFVVLFTMFFTCVLYSFILKRMS